MARDRRRWVGVWWWVLFAGCSAASAPSGPVRLPPDVPPAPAPSPAAASAPDPVYAALRAERERHGLDDELARVLGRSAAEAGTVAPVFAEKPAREVPDGQGGTLRIWRREGEPWILRVDATGTVVAYDVPTRGIAGRRGAPAVPTRGDRQTIVEGLDDLVGLPVDSLLGEGFTPIDAATRSDGSRVYTFRTPEGYFLSLGTDGSGVITAWSSNLPGLERPLRIERAAGR